MIPKIIHYCWFGGNPLPELAHNCIASWKKHCPDYEIKEWNESNFDLNCCDYVKEAYAAKKWAFVSDYARFLILYQYGGLYFDTDVELIKPIDDIVEKGPFMGFETEVSSKQWLQAAPGLGLAANPGLELYRELLDSYSNRHFCKSNGMLNQTTVVEYTTEILVKHGMAQTEKIQQAMGIWLYPKEYFCPMDYATGEISLTENTRSIHHFSASWYTKEEMRLHNVYKWFQSKLGREKGFAVAKTVMLPYRIYVKLKTSGFKNTAELVKKKFKRK